MLVISVEYYSITLKTAVGTQKKPFVQSEVEA